MRILEFPETRQVFNFDCGANALVSVLVFAGLEEREDRVAMLARTTHNGTSTTGILRVMQYYGLPYRAGQRMKVNDLRRSIDAGFPPTLVTLQAYRESNRPYRELWEDGHWTVAIGHDTRRILFRPECLPPHLAGRRRATPVLARHGSRQRIWQWGCTVVVSGQFKTGHHLHMD